MGWRDAPEVAAPATSAGWRSAPEAGPSRVFTGAEERAAEEKKLVDSMGPLERLLVGLGAGMYGTHLNVSDMVGHLPGLSRVDPRWWRDEKELYGRTLGSDTAAGVADLAGQTALLAPVGGAAGAVARAALPPALAALAPVLSLGAEGAAQGAVAAGPGRRGEGALFGTQFGVGAGTLGHLLGRLAGAAGGRADAIRAAQLEKARAAKAAEIKSAAGELGAATQRGSRLEEQFARYAEDPNIPAELRDAIAAWKASPRSQELLSDVLTNQLRDAPSVSGAIAGKQSALRALQEGAEEAVQQAANQAVSSGAAFQQVKARALRYGLPALGGYLGHQFLGPLGGTMGLAGGAVLRPMMHSMRRLAKNPAVQTSLLRNSQAVLRSLSRLTEAAALGEAPIIPAALPEVPELVPVFAGQDPDRPRLADLLRQAPR